MMRKGACGRCGGHCVTPLDCAVGVERLAECNARGHHMPGETDQKGCPCCAHCGAVMKTPALA